MIRTTLTLLGYGILLLPLSILPACKKDEPQKTQSQPTTEVSPASQAQATPEENAPVAAAAAAAEEAVDYASPQVGTLTSGTSKPSDEKGQWTQFRGPNRDNIAPDAHGIARSWGAAGPKVLWTIEGLCDGYAGPAIFNGRVYFHDYDYAKKLWMARCVSLADGQEIWRWSYPRAISRNHGVTRTVPAVDGQHVFSLDPKCVLHCFDAETGKRLWAIDLAKQYGATIPPWYNGQCPLMEEDRIIVGIGSKSTLMAAFDKATGKPLWQAPNPGGHLMSHSSVMPASIDGVKQYLWGTLKGIVSVSQDGKLLWEQPWKCNVAVAPSPLPLPDGKVFMTSGYQAGSIMIQVRHEADQWTSTVLFTRTDKQLGSDCHTPILLNDHLYFVSSADKRGRLVCADLQGNVMWQNNELTFGLGSFLSADGLLLLLDGDTGSLRLIDPNPSGYKELAEANVLSGHDVWAPMAYAKGKLVLRDMSRMVCIDISQH